MSVKSIVLALATFTTALVAGLFYGFAVAINPAFARLPAPQYIAAMQAINEAIQNPIFLASFLGAPFFLPLATVLHVGRPVSRRCWLLGAASIMYLVGSLGVTVAANIPLNETLAAFPLQTASPAAAVSARAAFESPWNKWHRVRTIAATVALGLAVGACLSAPAARAKPM
ncbi:anthrone oxygenase family protein [Hymenobacter terricola]|uniref:anthrone oxygenase family protein n=1 Tax=Hymenobacter terricola TaxID=2819236 RepID=UPI001B3005C7|nr:anthrone oxygenase family protein [Hymenobacter terricola]